MTDTKHRSAEFEARVESSGRIMVPEGIARGLRKRYVHVRLTTDPIDHQLRKRGVSGEEVERITAMQLASREQVVRFLLSEGTLKKSGIARRGR